jgi:hypothetical protein
MRTSWSRGQATPNKVDNNLESRKSYLIELWPKCNPVSKNQRYWKKNLDLDITLYLKILSMRMTPRS